MQHMQAAHVRIPKPLLRRHWRIVLAVVCLAALILGGGLARADSDHDRARDARQAGQVLPLASILERVAREHTGKVLDVELDRDKDNGVVRWVYEVKVLTPGGTRLKLKIDAKSGELISRTHKDSH